MYNLEILGRYDFFKNCDLNHSFDYLTNVLDRRTITAFINYQIKNKKTFSIIICDFDNFKKINDYYGHFYGDEALKRMADELVKSTIDVGVVGRFGGDEFLIYIDETNDYDEVWKVCKNINNNTKKIKFEDKLKDLIVTQTIGVARFPFDSKTYEGLFLKADKALYRGKQKGRNCFIIYKDELHKHIDVSRNTPLVVTEKIVKKAHDIMEESVTKEEKIIKIIEFMRNEYGLDHICINNSDKLDYVSVKKGLEYKYLPISNELYEKTMVKDSFHVNDFSTLLQTNQSLHQELFDQHIKACAIYKIYIFNKFYGYLRIDDSTLKRVWQDSELLTFEIICKYIAFLLAS